MQGTARLFCLLTLAGMLGLLLGAHDRPSAAAGQDAWKAAHTARVVAELTRREVADLSDAQRAKRARMLATLRVYGEEGRFAQNEAFPGEAIPHLIDQHGTRCALAHLIDVSGHDDLLQQLAQRNNIAFVPELARDAALEAWLREHGLSLEEAAYIQAPGYIDWPPIEVEEEPGLDPMLPEPVEPPPRHDGPPEAGTPATPSAPAIGGRGRGRSATASSDARWATWWRLNRHAYLNLRASYHKGLVVTGAAGEDRRGRRPSEENVDRAILPVLRELATGPDKRVRATALMAWARAARSKDAPEVVKAARTYLGDHDNGWRDIMLLTLGIVRHADGVAPLADVLADTKSGRALMSKNGALTSRTRAYAAIALGQSGQDAAVAPLRDILASESLKNPDLKASAVMALGTLARDLDAAKRRSIAAYLVKELRAGTWPDVVLATIPAALANAGDDLLLLGTLQPVLERFRKPRLVRQSSALALGRSATKVNEALLDTLIATARRDPDDNARRFGLVALGEAAHAADAAGTRKLARFYEGAFAGRNVQKTDLPWLCISAALFGRSAAPHAESIRTRLLALAQRREAKERQAAAITALGLLGDTDALPALRALHAKAKDKLVRGALVETLGILRDRETRDARLALVANDSSGRVRYQAALGLGFSADPSIVGPLVDALTKSSSQEAKAALARVIGEIGDRRALPALLAVARDKDADLWTRRRAIGAIGSIAQASDHAWVSAYQRGVNWPVATPTLREVLRLF